MKRGRKPKTKTVQKEGTIDCRHEYIFKCEKGCCKDVMCKKTTKTKEGLLKLQEEQK